MKKLLITSIFVLMGFMALQAQENFEGVIIFDLKIDASELDPQTAAMMPKETTMYLSGNRICTQQKTAFTEQKVIVNANEKMFWLLLSMMGQNMAIQSTFAEALEDVDDTQMPEFTYLDEYKEIAGYKCQKVVMKDGENEVVSYLTNEIKGFENMYLDNPQFNKMKGFIMEAQTNTQGLSMTMTAREVKKEKVDEAVFAIPNNYQKMTMKEFQSMMGGGQ
ncbi:MAG: DUF4412 domain-containing protein [Bacteroidales bacterium]|nr:DUF4412 domain-containing protein [Bacteroidales bacterium]